MLTKLKKIYPSLTHYHRHLDNAYYWFLTEENEVFGILHDELNEKDLQLLLTFFRTYEATLPVQSTAEKRWHNQIYGDSTSAQNHPFRFIYFSIPKNQITAIDFHEALHTLFEKNYPILWENEAEGVLIEEIPKTEEPIQFEQIINILMSDFAVNIHFFIGTVQYSGADLKETFERTVKLGKEIFLISSQNVMHYMESIPYLLLSQLSEADRFHFSSTTLQQFYNDSEMLKTLDHYFKSNLNISETAKNMYMHRNSIQYRIDKFTKETNINLQVFDEAISVKLAMLAKTLL